MTALTVANIEAGYDDERWLGFGYLGERRYQHADEVAQADGIVLDYAAKLGWDAEDLFAWCNSKDGRWYGDWAFGSAHAATELMPSWLPRLFPKKPDR